MEKFRIIVAYLVPMLAGFITTVVIPLLIRRFTIKKLTSKIEEVEPNSQLKEIKEKIDRIDRNIKQIKGE